ncbi:MAG: nucleotide exchange factor GrpE [Lachnospiraceae bacterium]|nr:nucleotide exchange factor GrpE [Lachnospiraceae bacterium]
MNIGGIKVDNKEDELKEQAESKEKDIGTQEKEQAGKDKETASEANEAEVSGDGKDDGAREKTKKSSKKEKEKKDKKDQKIDELNDRLMRLMAEYDNYRKRTEKEKSLMFEMGAKSIVEKIIPVIDNFERGFATVSDADKDNPFVMGMDKVYSQFVTSMEEAGVTAIDAVGKEFDPNIHNAVMHVDDDSLGDNIVAEELQKGYMYKDSVVRYSMVKVAN